MIIIIGIIVVVIILFIALFIISDNKFKLANIKIDKANEDIDLYLQKKRELLERSRPIIKKELKKESFMDDLNDINEDIDNFQNHLLLKKCYNELFKSLDENEKLYKSKTLVKILEDLNNNEENIVGAIKFYNDTVVDFNKLVVSFPSKIVATFKKYKKLDFYNNEKREIFEILNNK